MQKTTHTLLYSFQPERKINKKKESDLASESSTLSDRRTNTMARPPTGDPASCRLPPAPTGGLAPWGGRGAPLGSQGGHRTASGVRGHARTFHTHLFPCLSPRGACDLSTLTAGGKALTEAECRGPRGNGGTIGGKDPSGSQDVPLSSETEPSASRKPRGRARVRTASRHRRAPCRQRFLRAATSRPLRWLPLVLGCNR